MMDGHSIDASNDPQQQKLSFVVEDSGKGVEVAIR
jgi:hypothetical protein